MSLKRVIAHNTLIQIVGKTISVLLGLLAVAIMTRSLGVEQFGWYVTAAGFLQFIGIFSDFGFTITTANMLSEPYFDKNKLLNNLFTWRFLTAFLFQGLAPILILLFPYPAPIKMAVLVTTLSFFAISLNNIFIGYYQSQLKMFIQMSGEILGRIVLVVGLLLVARGNYGFLPTMGVVTLASVIYTFYLWLRSPGARFAFDRAISKAIFIKIWPTALTVIFNAFYLQGDRVILPLYASQADVGLYGAAYRVLDMLAQAAAMIMGIMMPLVTFAWSRNLLEDFKKRYQMSFDLVCLFLLPAMAGILVLAQPIMLVIAGAEFGGSAKILQYLAVAIVGLSFGNVFGYIALAINRQRQAIGIYLADAVLAIIGYFVFIPRYGLYGAAYVTIFSELFAGLGLLLLIAYYAKIWPRLFTFIKIALASLIMGAILFYLQPLNLILSILIGIAFYTLLVLIFRIITLKTVREVLSRG